MPLEALCKNIFKYLLRSMENVFTFAARKEGKTINPNFK